MLAPAPPAAGVTVRPIDPLDGAELVRFYAELSPESRHARFFGAMRIDERAARTMVEADGVSRLGLVATERASGAIVGHLCLEPSGPDAAEIGIAVADIWQGHGIGRALLVEGLAWARRHRLRQLVGYALSDNSRILRLASTLGVPCSIRSVGDGLVSATLAVEPGP
jgi:acetyltransferase